MVLRRGAFALACELAVAPPASLTFFTVIRVILALSASLKLCAFAIGVPIRPFLPVRAVRVLLLPKHTTRRSPDPESEPEQTQQHQQHLLRGELVRGGFGVDLAELADDAERREVAEHGCRTRELPWERVARAEP